MYCFIVQIGPVQHILMNLPAIAIEFLGIIVCMSVLLHLLILKGIRKFLYNLFMYCIVLKINDMVIPEIKMADRC